MLNECLMGESREKAGRKQGESWEKYKKKNGLTQGQPVSG
jgi:hypothetical protein